MIILYSLHQLFIPLHLLYKILREIPMNIKQNKPIIIIITTTVVVSCRIQKGTTSFMRPGRLVSNVSVRT